MTMRITTSQHDLSTALQLVGRAISSRPTHPVLANVLLTADAAAGRLSLTGFDLNLGIQTSIPAQVEAGGSFTIPARLLSDITARLAADQPLTLAVTGEQVELTSLSGSYTMRGLPAADYPELPGADGEPVELNAAALLAGLRATLFASSTDESKQILTGVHLQHDGSHLELAATDGHRLAVLRLEAAGTPFELTIPARSLRELERMLSGVATVTLSAGAGQAVITAPGMSLSTRLLDGTYPNYPQLIPASFKHQATADRRALLASLERVAVLADQHNNVIKLTCDPERGLVLIRADAQDVGSGHEAVAAEVTGAIELAFNVRYLLDGLKVMAADRVTLYSNAATSPAVLRSEADQGFTYLVMPVQVRA